MKPIEPQIIDGMPRAVATAILTEPKAALSNRWRKVCMRACDKVFVSLSPIIRVMAVDSEDLDKILPDIHCWTEREPIDTEAKTARRFACATLRQLGKWCARAIKRRVVAQRAYLAVPSDDTPRNNALRELYSALANKLDIIRDCAEYEINLRMRTAHGVEGVRREPGSSVDFRTRLPV